MPFDDFDEFSSFDLDFSDKAARTAPGEQAAESAPGPAEAAPVDDAEPAADAAMTAQQQDTTAADAAAMSQAGEAYMPAEPEEVDYTVTMPEGPDFCDEMGEKMEQESKEREAQRQKRQEKRQERSGAPKPKLDLPLSPQELQMAADDIDKHTKSLQKLVQPLNDAIAGSSRKLPKGIRSAARRIEEYTEAYRIARTLFIYIAATDSDTVLGAVKEAKLLNAVKTAERNGGRTEKTLKATIKDLLQAIDDGNDEDAAIARQLKQQAMRLDTPAEKLTDALCDFILNYPDENGELAFFSIIAENADDEDMQRIDTMMRSKDKAVVAVADAPAMIEAMKTGDDKTIQDILGRMIDNMQ